MSYESAPSDSTSTVASNSATNAGTLRSRTRSARPSATVHGRLDQSGRSVEADHGLGLGHRHHPGLDQHRGHPDRPVPAHRQQPRDLDEQHAPVGVGASRRLQERAGHRRVATGLAHQQQPEMVQVLLEVQPALLHRVAGDRTESAGDHARRHPLGVRVDRGEVGLGPHAPTLARSHRFWKGARLTRLRRPRADRAGRRGHNLTANVLRIERCCSR